MQTYELSLTTPVIGEHISELRRRIYYLSESITSFRLIYDGEAVRAVGCDLAGWPPLLGEWATRRERGRGA